MEQQSLIDRVVAIEWEMFAAVPNVGGQADCQDDRLTFQVMRRSQAQTWTTELLESYLDDLRTARRQGINLMSIKYARMMETTHPEEFERIKDELPAVDAETLARIDEVVAVHRAWDEEVAARYPRLRGRGRPAATQDDSAGRTSAETYMRGELATFSARTVELVHRHTLASLAQGVNLAEKTLEYTVRAYGFNSLEDAEKAL